METLRLSEAATTLARSLKTERFRLLDVGCSGGIHPAWRTFEPRLSALGFDPSQHAISTLQSGEDNPEVRYVAGFVGLPPGHPLKGRDPDFWRVDPWGRLAAYHTQARQLAGDLTSAKGGQPIVPDTTETDIQQDLMERNLWQKADLSTQEKVIVFPAALHAMGIDDVDFIKIDVDGDDFEILQSLDGSFDRMNVIGAVLEVNFHGSAAPGANSFHNVDRYMRSQGFDLMDLRVRRYAVDALPFPFSYPYPLAAQNTGGRVFQGDALYLRDFSYPHGGVDAKSWSSEKLVKLAAVQALFGLYDHAAETLINFGARIATIVDIESVLDQLALEIQSAGDRPSDAIRYKTFAEYRSAYESQDDFFYGAEAKAIQSTTILLDENRALEERVRQLTLDVGDLRLSLDAACIDLQAIRSSTTWRFAAPLRALRLPMGRKR